MLKGGGGQNVCVCMKERGSTELLIGLEKLIQKRTVVFRRIVDFQKLNRYFILRLKSISFLFPFLSWSVCWFHGYHSDILGISVQNNNMGIYNDKKPLKCL